MEKSNTRKGRRKSSSMNKKKIPTFGDWESVNNMPITQYFDDARQAGLIKIQSNHDDSNRNFNYIHNCKAAAEFHQQYSDQQYYPSCPPQVQIINNNKDTRRSQRSREMMPGSCNTQRGTNNKTVRHSVKTTTAAAVAPSKPKPVDEDLYKIPPHLIYSSSLPSSPPRRQKKKLGFISRCLVPCAA